MIVSDGLLEWLGISTVIIGLVFGYFAVFDFSHEDVLLSSEDEAMASVTGVVQNTKSYDSGYMSIEVMGCRNMSVMTSDDLAVEMDDIIHVTGSFSDGVLWADDISVR